MKRVLAIDQGTTATKTYTLDTDGRFTHCQTMEHRQIYPRSGWVEHDPEELLSNVISSISDAGTIESIGIDNQGETVIAWNGETGQPVYHAIVWQDQRTIDFIEGLKKEGAEAITLERAGLPLDPYFSASKLRWILQNVPKAGKLLKAGKLKLGTSEVFFLHRLTGEYATDVTTASRTSLMNLRTCRWDPVLCDLFKIPMDLLPDIRPTTGRFGSMDVKGREVTITASVVDQQASLFGHGCTRIGQIKATFGTGVFAQANVGPTIQSHPDSGILPTVAWQIENKAPVYALDAGVYNAGSAINWTRQLGLFDNFREIDQFHRPPAVSRGLVFVPALSGLACPFWDRSAAGLWLGLSLETDRTDLCQAVLEGIALRTAQLLDAIDNITGGGQPLSVDGGLINNAYFRQFLANVIQRQIIVPATSEITTFGTACFAMIGSGLVKTLSDLPPSEKPTSIISPQDDWTSFKPRFAEAIKRSRNWHGNSRVH